MLVRFVFLMAVTVRITVSPLVGASLFICPLECSRLVYGHWFLFVFIRACWIPTDSSCFARKSAFGHPTSIYKYINISHKAETRCPYVINNKHYIYQKYCALTEIKKYIYIHTSSSFIISTTGCPLSKFWSSIPHIITTLPCLALF
jgi:hypothetical protein